MHHAIDALLVLVTGCLFVLLVRIRPGGRPLSRGKIVGLFIVGVVIGLIFVSTHNIYAPPPV